MATGSPVRIDSTTLPPIPPLRKGKMSSGGDIPGNGCLSYTTQGVKHTLPLVPGLPSGGEVEPSLLDHWPACPAGEGTSHLHLGSPVKTSLFTGRRYRLSPTQANISPGRMRKPAFLQQLEQDVDRELQLLRCGQGPGGELVDIFLQLQCYRSAFERIIGEFHVYRPILSSIKVTYDNTIQMLHENVVDLLPLKLSLKTVEEECERKLLDCQRGDKQELQDIQKVNSDLHEVIAKLRQEKKDVEAQVQKLSQELSDLFREYTDERDARKLLISEVNDLKNRQQEAGSMKRDGNDDDPVLLQMRVKGLSDELTAARQREIQMMADYSDVVPRKEHEKLLAKHKEVAEKLDVISTAHEKLLHDHEALEKVHEEATTQRDNLASECKEVKRSCTPRPDWDQCADQLVSEDVDWSEIRPQRSSNQMMSALLAKVKGEPLPPVTDGRYGPDRLECLGTAKNVPEHLRFTGSVHNRHLRQKELLILMQEVWLSYAAQRPKSVDKKKGKDVSMSSFLWSMLERRYALPLLVAEWSYSIHNACQRYATENAHIGLFHAILNGQIDDTIYFEQVARYRQLLETLNQKAAENGGMLNMETFMESLQEFFPMKSTASVETLCDAAMDQANKGTEEEPLIDVSILFSEDETGYSSDFIYQLRQQERQEKVDYLAEVENALQAASSEVFLEVSLGQLRKAIQIVDPEKPEPELNMVLGYAFGKSPEQLPADSTTAPTVQIFERLQTKVIQRSGPPPAT